MTARYWLIALLMMAVFACILAAFVLF